MKPRIWMFLVLLLFYSSSLIAQNEPPVVTNVSAVVDPDLHIVSISYDIYDNESDNLFVELKISNDNGITFLHPFDEISGDVGFPVIPGANKQIIWNYDPVTTNFSNGAEAGFRAKIIADDFYEPDIQNIVDEVSSERIIANLNTYEGIRHRDTGIPLLEDTKNFIEGSFESNNLQTRRHEFYYDGYNAANIIGRKQGNVNEEMTYVLGGHFDSISWGPGADDNLSGTVAMVEVMNILAKYEFENSINFLGFDLEEDGMIGSNKYVQSGIQDYEQIEGMFNLDAIAHCYEEPNTQTVLATWENLFPEFYAAVEADDFRGNFILAGGNLASSTLVDAFSYSASTYVPDLRVLEIADNDANTQINNSDNGSFWSAGYPAIWVNAHVKFRNQWIHTAQDVVSRFNMEFYLNVIKAVVGMVAEVAGIQHTGIGISSGFELEPGNQITNTVALLGSWASGLTHSKQTANDRVLVFFSFAENNSDISLNSVTYGNQQMTKITDQVYTSLSTWAYVSAFILKESDIAAATDNSFSTTWSSNPQYVNYCSAFFSGVHQTDPVGEFSSNGSTQPTISTDALNTNSGDMVILSAACGNTGTYFVNNDFTKGIDVSITSADGVSGHKSAQGGLEVPSVTHSNVNRQVIIGLVLNFAENDGSLPVQLSSFEAYHKDNNVILNWTTQSEIENLGFEIQRKEIHYNIENDYSFKKIAFIAGKGNSNYATNYSFSDSDIKTDCCYSYRLKQIDISGHFDFSEEKIVDLKALPSLIVLKQNYPNPFNPKTTIEFQIDSPSYINLTVTNLLGQELFKLLSGPQLAGSHKVQWDASFLSSGVYFYKLDTDKGFSQTKKMVLSK
ncbi:MAG: M28 family peptidase [Calditrichaeota bacterium]|nr:M28 family peptidase [Calditrichota bacterium]